MKDALDKLAEDVTRDVIKICTKIAEIHTVQDSENDWQRGYNQAIEDIADKIRRLL